jgi:hypothetical protein
MFVKIGQRKQMQVQDIPIPLLIAVCKNIHKGNRLGVGFERVNGKKACEACFKRLKQVNPNHWLVESNVPTPCSLCASVGLYRITLNKGKLMVFCKKHLFVANKYQELVNAGRYAESNKYWDAAIKDYKSEDYKRTSKGNRLGEGFRKAHGNSRV